MALCLFTNVNAQIINIPDANFKAKLLAASPSNSIALNSANSSIKIDVNNNGEIEVAEASNVYGLNVSNSAISDLTGISYFVNLKQLSCFENLLTSLDITQNTALTNLDCRNNMLSSLNLTYNTALTNLDCRNNMLSSLNLTYNTALKILYCNNNQITSLDLSQNPVLSKLYCSSNQLTNLNVTQTSALSDLRCYDNHLTNLNVTQNAALATLVCSSNMLTNIDLTNNIALKGLNCGSNYLTSLNVTQNLALNELICDNNQLTSLDISQNIFLKLLGCSYNSLTSLNVTQKPDLEIFICKNNQLVNIDVTQNPKLYDFRCGFNQITSLDLSENTLLTYFNCSNNPLQSLFIKNNSQEIDIDDNYDDLPIFTFSNLPDLQYICADDFQVEAIQNQIAVYGYTNCHVNSYCSFVPGGNFYTIQGNQKFDENNNGCDASDIPLSNLKFNITDGTTTGSLISNTSGNYSIPVQAGTHTITPVFENPAYFTASPSSVNVTFPTQTSPFTQNFCVTANGAHPDLEVSILPINVARPGFDTTYKLIYKNKGNTTQSGSVNLVFNDAVLDFVSANPVVTTQTVNNLTWNFTNLLPFETREITFTLNVNSPMETPAVNNGEVLNYTATITSLATDDMPNDNTFVFNQTVVNSFDPNDKTCLEGATIPPSKVGDYVHYMIRFENNGTANAQNIVVKDMIDTNKFDISSLVPIKGSHSFVTNISAGNKVEFIFENINLPFDDANNDGYVSFKIKTKPTLTNGDTFSNSASIYFDYNFPIVTNTATTTIQALSRQDFEFSNYFKLYPNPVTSTLNIDAKDAIQISSINIYNTLGQLVLVVPNAQDVKTIDVSNLSSGNYFIKINSDKGTSNTKFIKQ